MKNKKEQTDKIISTIQKNCGKENESTVKIKENEIKEHIKIEDLEDKVDDYIKKETEYDDDFDEYDEE